MKAEMRGIHTQGNSIIKSVEIAAPGTIVSLLLREEIRRILDEFSCIFGFSIANKRGRHQRRREADERMVLDRVSLLFHKR